MLLNNETSLTFIVSPKEAAAAIAEAAQDNAEVVTAYVSRTMARTKAVDMPTTLTVTSVNGNAEGILEVGVSDANLPDDFWKDLNEGNIYISISDGNNDVLSELIPILPMSYIATPTDFIQALNAAKATGDVVRLSSDIVLETPVTLSTGDALTIDLNGHTLSTESTNNSGNFDLFLVNGANLTIKNGTITTKHVGADMGWSAMTTAFDVTAGGVLNIENATIKNLGGSSMSFCVHLNNWGEVTLNINNSTLESTYIPVRVFNSGPQMNNVTINNSKLTGKYCFWVHNYKPAGDTVGDAANLNFDIYNGTNEFENTGKSPVLYGFTNAIYFDQNGNEYVSDGVIKDADGNYHISNVAGLNWVAEQVNTMEYYVSAAANILDEKTVYLDNDIDCNGAELTPIGDYAFSRTIFRGVFDGQNHTISNFKITEKTQWEQKVTEASYGLFGNMNGTVKNLIVMGAAVKPDGGRYSAALVGRFGGGLIENCHVKNSSVEISHWQVGGLVGQWNDGKIINCSVTNVQVTGYAAVGALVGMALTKGERFIENCEVAGCDLIQNGTFGESYDSMFGLILGSENADDLTVNISGCSLSNNTIKGDASTTIYGDGDGVNIIN